MSPTDWSGLLLHVYQPVLRTSGKWIVEEARTEHDGSEEARTGHDGNRAKRLGQSMVVIEQSVSGRFFLFAKMWNLYCRSKAHELRQLHTAVITTMIPSAA